MGKLTFSGTCDSGTEAGGAGGAEEVCENADPRARRSLDRAAGPGPSVGLAAAAGLLGLGARGGLRRAHPLSLGAPRGPAVLPSLAPSHPACRPGAGENHGQAATNSQSLSRTEGCLVSPRAAAPGARGGGAQGAPGKGPLPWPAWGSGLGLSKEEGAAAREQGPGARRL